MKKIKFNRIIGLLLVIQMLLVTIMPSSIVKAEANSNVSALSLSDYSNNDRYYSVTNKVKAEDEYIKLDISQGYLNVYGIKYNKSYAQVTLDGKEIAKGSIGSNGVFNIYTRLTGYDDGDYTLRVSTSNYSSYGFSTTYEFRLIIDDGSAFFYKDFSYKNNQHTLKFLNAIVNSKEATDTSYLGSNKNEIINEAKKITSTCSNNYEKVKAIYKWVTENIYYGNGDSENFSNKAEEVYRERHGVCYGYANIFTALCRAINIPCVTICGGACVGEPYMKNEPKDHYDSSDEGIGPHAWNAYYIDGQWRYCDATWDSHRGFENGIYKVDSAATQCWFDASIDYMSYRHINQTTSDIAFASNNFGFTLVGENYAVEKYYGNNPNIILPTNFNGINIESTGWKGFQGNDTIKSVVIPKVSTFNILGYAAFLNCKNLESIFVPSTITDIDGLTLIGCSSKLTIYCEAGSAMEKYAQSNNMRYKIYNPQPEVLYSSIIQGKSSFENYSYNGTLSGTEGEGKRIEGLKIDSVSPKGLLLYRAYINNVGWTNWVSSCKEIKGNGRDIERIEVKVAEEFQNVYDVYYRTHIRYFGWLGWTKNGQEAGTKDAYSAIEGFEVKLVEKGTVINGITNDAKEPLHTIVRKTVKFVDYDGTVLSTQNVEVGKNAVAPANPTRAEYTFIGWDKSYNNISEDEVITAQYKRNVRITSVDINGGKDIVAGKEAYIKINTNFYNDLKYSINITSIAGNKNLLINSSSNVVKWIPSESYANAYCDLNVAVFDNLSYESVTTTKGFTVKEKTNNQTTIYYRGYDNPNIHYKIGNGEWTTAPGVKMESNRDVDGYYYSITIDLGEEDNLTACFNDGKGNWDSNDGKNYSFGVGYYTFSNKTINKIDKPSSKLKINSITCSSGSTIKMGSTVDMKINASGGEGEYKYYLYYYGYGSGKLNYILNGSTNNTGSYKPDYPQTTTLYAKVVDKAGNVATYQQAFNVKEKTNNQTTIYYRGYDNPNIHYKIGNGEWTTAPGVKMESNRDVDGYYYSITIDLGEEDNLTACFNDGKGNWDSNDGKNYSFGVGYYTFSNKTINKIDKPSSKLKINSITCSSGSTIKMGSTVDMKINASGGEGEYKYYLYYYGYGSGKLNYILNGSTNNTGSYKPDYPQTTTLYAKVVDKAGNVVTYQQVFNVKEITTNQVTIYYKGYENPNIHYQIGNGAWTDVPGVKMESNRDVDGYYYSITIDLGNEEKLTACFNDGKGNWDSNNGKNYNFGVGKYTYCGGKITEIK